MKTLILALALLIPTEALANGTVKRAPSQSSTIQVYEPRQPEPWLGVSVFGGVIALYDHPGPRLIVDLDRFGHDEEVVRVYVREERTIKRRYYRRSR